MKIKLLYLLILSTITLFSQTQIGNNIDGEASSDKSGWSVSLSADGAIVAIGAYLNNGNGADAGHVRIYKNNAGIWTQIGDDIDGEFANDQSGYSVSLSADGTIVAVGAIYNVSEGIRKGHVRVYQNISDVWTQVGDDIDGEATNNRFGSSVSLSSDGNTVAIGAPYNSGNTYSSGHVRVYQNISNVWSQIGDDIDGELQNDQSGHSVSLSSDGNTVAIGAPYNSANGGGSGHVRVYQNVSDVWSQIGDDIDGEGIGSYSGWSVSLSSDGSIVAIGARQNGGSGHVRVYQNISDVWNQIGDDIDGEAYNDMFGHSVSMSSDGSMVAIGAFNNDGVDDTTGQVRVYKNNAGVWTQIGVNINGEAKSDHSGWSVSLSSDGNTVAIGAPNNNSTGDVRVFNLFALLSLEDNEITKNFTVYPNPVNNYLQLQLTTTLEYKKATIYNYSGQLVLQSNTTKINVSSLSSGVYFLEVETNEGKGVKRIIKK